MSTDVDLKLPLPLRGIVPPLVTPLTETGKFDARSFSTLIERVIEGGVHGLFLLGTTGEFCSLSTETRKQVVSEGCRAAAKRVPVVVNVSDTSFEESLKLARHAAGAGATAVAICPPYYFSVTQEDLLRYTQKFAEASDLPVFLYNIPQNAHVEFEADTVRRLADVPNVAGLKNSNGSVEYTSQVSQVKARRPEFSLLVGTEEIMMTAMEAGADGSVCGGANRSMPNTRRAGCPGRVSEYTDALPIAPSPTTITSNGRSAREAVTGIDGRQSVKWMPAP